MTAIATALVALLLAEPTEVRVGSKKFTESVILGEMATLELRAAGLAATHRRELGGTRVLWDALVRGDLDVYPDYTGTLRDEIARGADPAGFAHAHGIELGRSLGFSDTYAIGMREPEAARLGMRRLSDLAAQPGLRFGFSDEFLRRVDGWPRVRSCYRLPHEDVRGLDHDLAYRALASGAIDATDVYSTDAEIRFYGLRVLEDDHACFPDYHAVLLYRADLKRRAPSAVAALRALEGRISVSDMIDLNARVKQGREPEQKVAAAFLQLAAPAAEAGLAVRVLKNGRDHLVLVAISLASAILFAIPLGIIAARRRRAGQLILAGVGIIQTIPSLALLVFMIPLCGIGALPAMVALFLYSLLPIVRNTHAGLTGIAPALLESADALGLPAGARLRLVELPLAARTILAGIKTSAVINVGTATLGALVGAGGYGQPILTGIRLADVGIILEGAVPAAVLALVVQWAFELAERAVVPRGLRLRGSQES